MVTAITNDKAICRCFGLYPSFVAGILNSTKVVHFYDVFSVKLNYEYYIKKCIGNRECNISYKCESGYFYKLSSEGDTIFIMFKERVFHEQLPSKLIFAQSVLKTKKTSTFKHTA